MSSEASLASRLDEAMHSIQQIHAGTLLELAASRVEERLPDGVVRLLVDSDEGLAVAAIVTARRSAKAEWVRLDLAHPIAGNGAQEVVLEVGNPPAAWWKAINSKYPEAEILVISGDGEVTSQPPESSP